MVVMLCMFCVFFLRFESFLSLSIALVVHYARDCSYIILQPAVTQTQCSGHAQKIYTYTFRYSCLSYPSLSQVALVLCALCDLSLLFFFLHHL